MESTLASSIVLMTSRQSPSCTSQRGVPSSLGSTSLGSWFLMASNRSS